MSKNPLIRPYLKWAGGKRQLVREIGKRIPEFTGRYYEPFVGAGAIFFHLQPSRATISDINEQLFLTYKAIRDNVEELISLLEMHKENNSSDHFYKIRGLDRNGAFEGMSEVEKAARTIYLNKTCYNGLYRVNSDGLFNTPYGKYRNPAICESDVLRSISAYLNKNGIKIYNKDFVLAASRAREGDFVYFDPPYDSPDSMNFTGYNAGGFDRKQQIRLKEFMVKLTERGVKCLLSNSSTDFIRDIYGEVDDFTVNVVKANRMINSNPNGRGTVDEVLVSNW